MINNLLSTKWVDYVEESMKYQALKLYFFPVVDGWWVLGVGWGWLGGWVMVGWVDGVG